MQSYSQLGQDIAVVNTYKGISNGFFVEIGANDGITFSNTYLLEKEYHWRGICIEPIPSAFESLQRARPNSICINKAVFHTSGEILPFDIAHNFDLLSGLSNHIGEKHRSRVDAHKTTISVETITLNDALKAANAPTHIDYLSLDTEGTEFEILQSVDLSVYTFGLIDVEHNYIEPVRTDIRKYLCARGYSYKGENKWDDCYIHNSLVDSCSGP